MPPISAAYAGYGVHGRLMPPSTKYCRRACPPPILSHIYRAAHRCSPYDTMPYAIPPLGKVYAGTQ
ncbi:MAG: hypothetical protein IKD10_04335 [Lentisphaeria bacterium]|nr:hypothetical protein [Lentisphaeria bacterium]